MGWVFSGNASVNFVIFVARVFSGRRRYQQNQLSTTGYYVTRRLVKKLDGFTQPREIHTYIGS
jgi:hypothetical protein